MKLRDKPCERCRWKFPGFHICLDRPAKVMREVVPLKPKRKKAESEHDDVRGTDEWRQRISEARRAGAQKRQDEERIRNRERDREIVRQYDEEDKTVRELAADFLLDHRTVLSVLHRAADEGEVVIRPAARRVRS